ncbi:hypothetical protein NL449_27245, partial [Klebsiella pneumoniae]|nr:hypothetical protein [Klebsiella pneumoniae]
TKFLQFATMHLLRPPWLFLPRFENHLEFSIKKLKRPQSKLYNFANIPQKLQNILGIYQYLIKLTIFVKLT